MSFRALMLEKQDGGPLAHIVDLDDAALSAPEALANEVTAGDVLIRVDWSTINYKDGLAITGKGPVVRKWPMVAGIDGAGVVLDSSHPDWRTGDAVVLNGWGVGETHWGASPSRRGFRAIGWWHCRRGSTRGRPWRSARPATRRCCRCWRWSVPA